MFLRFLIVGTLNTLFSYGLYAGLIRLGVHYALANLLALLAGILVSFKTQGAFVFKSSKNSLLWRFVAAWALIYAVGIALITAMVRAGLDAYAAGAAATPFTTVLSYLCQRHFVFRDALLSKPFDQGDA